MSEYKIISYDAIEGQLKFIQKTNPDGTVCTIPEDPDNTDYQAYLAWLEDGNEPESAPDTL